MIRWPQDTVSAPSGGSLAIPFGQRQIQWELPTVTITVTKSRTFLRTCAEKETEASPLPSPSSHRAGGRFKLSPLKERPKALEQIFSFSFSFFCVCEKQVYLFIFL